MSGNIHQFITGFRGGTRLNRFKVQTTCPSINEPFHITAAQIPGAVISSIGVNWFGRTVQIPGERVYQPWVITVLDDYGADYELHSYFEAWQHSIGNKDDNTLVDLTDAFTKTSIGLNSVSRGGCNFFIDQYRADSDSIEKRFTLWNVWPVQIGPIELDMSKDNQLCSFNVTLMYTHFVYDN